MSTPLQYGFAARYGTVAFDAAGRRKKAAKVLRILEHAVGDLPGKSLLDIGCSTGYLTNHYAEEFRQVFGTDIDLPALQHARSNAGKSRPFWVLSDSQRLPFPSGSIDVVSCTHIYEHVPDANLLMDEIYRVLRPGGACFFSAGNRFSLIEPHYRLPLLSAIPKPLAHLYLRVLGRGNYYEENHLGYRGLRRLVSRFTIEDYTRRVVSEPERFGADDMLTAGSPKQRLALSVLRIAYWLCPTYLWVLRKDHSGA